MRNILNFSKLSKIILGAIFLFFATWSMAQNRPIEDGFDFRTLPVAQPLETKGKIEVIEFFWYACPHCYDFEPELSAWIKRQGPDVVVRKIPVAFREDLLPHSQLFYALEALGRPDLHRKVMDAIHVGKKAMLSEAEISDWLPTQGVDRQKFSSAFRSFTVISKARGSIQIAQNYRIDGVPTVAIQGKYITSPSIAGGSKARAIDVMDYLVNKVRKEKR